LLNILIRTCLPCLCCDFPLLCLKAGLSNISHKHTLKFNNEINDMLKYTHTSVHFTCTSVS
jgi:hypothetical protein